MKGAGEHHSIGFGCNGRRRYANCSAGQKYNAKYLHNDFARGDAGYRRVLDASRRRQCSREFRSTNSNCSGRPSRRQWLSNAGRNGWRSDDDSRSKCDSERAGDGARPRPDPFTGISRATSSRTGGRTRAASLAASTPRQLYQGRDTTSSSSSARSWGDSFLKPRLLTGRQPGEIEAPATQIE